MNGAHQQGPGPRVSVVVATFNGELYIREQLETILAQSLPPWEVIVSDDGSSDGTLAIVAEVAAHSDVPVTIRVNPHNLGFADNFIRAAESASGDYVAFSDQDDRWAPLKLERQVGALHRFDALLCAHVVGQIDTNGVRIALPSTGGGPRVTDPVDADPWGNYYGFTMVFRRDLLRRLPSGSRGTDPHSHGSPLSHDRWAYFLASTFGRMVELDEHLADYRQHDRQLYGGLKHRSIPQRIADKRSSGHHQCLDLAGVADHRAALLETLGGEQAATASLRWRSWADGLRRSSVIYGHSSLGRRSSVLVDNIRRGVYSGTARGGLGNRRLRQDLVMTTLPRRRAP